MMNNLKKDVIKINNDMVVKIKKEYLVLLNRYRKQFVSILNRVASEYIKGISESELEEWVDTYLISLIKLKGVKRIEEIGISLDGCLDEISNINSYDDYVKYVDNILSSNTKKNIWLHNIVSDFQSDFIRELRNYYNSNKEKIEVNDFDKSLLLIRSDLRSALRRSCDNFLDEYKLILKRELLNNLTLMKKKFFNGNSSLVDIFNKFSSVVVMFGYSLVIRDNKLFIRDNKGLEVEMVYDNDLLREKDKFMLEFGVNSSNNIVWYADRYKNIIVRYVENRIEVGLGDNKRISVLKIRDGVSYFLNDQVVDSLNEMDEKIFMEKLPFFYQMVVSWHQNKNKILVKKR